MSTKFSALMLERSKTKKKVRNAVSVSSGEGDIGWLKKVYLDF